MFLFVAGRSLGSFPQGKQAGTKPFSKSPLSGAPSMAPSCSVGSAVSVEGLADLLRFPFLIFAEGTRERLVSAMRILTPHL